jgi:hypothetical protein
MKSNPCSPKDQAAETIFSTAADISAFSIKRTTVACPAELTLLITSK